MSSKRKSIGMNMILNSIRGMMRIVFPLITFPYSAKVLGVEGLGRYNFAGSFVGYFVMFAALGLSTYAIREGAKIRDDKYQISKFSSEMFSINVISSLLSYIVMFLCMYSVGNLHRYTDLVLILSLQIAFNTIGIEWIYSIYEDYLYITVRSIAFQILSLALLFIFVHSPSDLRVYTAITVVSSVGSNVLNYLNSRKFIKLRFTLSIDWKKHFKPILVLFATTLTVKIYANSDVLILGFLKGDYEVGLYSAATKVYEVVKTILSSIIIVSIPRLAYLTKNDSKKEFDELATKIYSILVTAVFPALIGIILLRREIILLVSNSEYLGASVSLSFLSVALIFSLCGWFWGQCVLVPYGQENIVFKASLVSAVLNIVLNFILIPFGSYNAAALTTLVAELVQFIWCSIYGKKIVQIVGIQATVLKTIIGCVAIIVYVLALGVLHLNTYIYITFSIAGAGLIYGIVEIILKNKYILDLLEMVKKKLKK